MLPPLSSRASRHFLGLSYGHVRLFQTVGGHKPTFHYADFPVTSADKSADKSATNP